MVLHVHVHVCARDFHACINMQVYMYMYLLLVCQAVCEYGQTVSECWVVHASLHEHVLCHRLFLCHMIQLTAGINHTSYIFAYTISVQIEGVWGSSMNNGVVLVCGIIFFIVVRINGLQTRLHVHVYSCMRLFLTCNH